MLLPPLNRREKVEGAERGYFLSEKKNRREEAPHK